MLLVVERREHRSEPFGAAAAPASDRVGPGGLGLRPERADAFRVSGDVSPGSGGGTLPAVRAGILGAAPAAHASDPTPSIRVSQRRRSGSSAAASARVRWPAMTGSPNKRNTSTEMRNTASRGSVAVVHRPFAESR